MALSVSSSHAYFIFLALCVIVIFLISCVVEEWMYFVLPGFKHYWTVAFFELLFFMLGGYVERAYKQKKTDQLASIPDAQALNATPSTTESDCSNSERNLEEGNSTTIKKPNASFQKSNFPSLQLLFWYALASIILVYAQTATKIANNYVNYATNTVLKSVKLLITMIFATICFSKKKFSKFEWLGAFAMVISCIYMSLGDHAMSPSFSTLGVFLSVSATVLQSFMGNIQEKVLSEKKSDGDNNGIIYAEMVQTEEMKKKEKDDAMTQYLIYSNGIGVVVIFLVLIFTGELFSAIDFFLFSGSFIGLIALFVRSFTFFTGGYAYLKLIQDFGVAAATVVAVVRKIMTVLLSFMIYPKPFHINYVIGVVFFIAADGLYLYNIYCVKKDSGKEVEDGNNEGRSNDANYFDKKEKSLDNMLSNTIGKKCHDNVEQSTTSPRSEMSDLV